MDHNIDLNYRRKIRPVSQLITMIFFYSQNTYPLCYQKPLNSRGAMQKRKHKLLALYSVADHFDVELPTQFLMISCSEICTQISVNGAKQNFHVVIPLLVKGLAIVVRALASASEPPFNMRYTT